MGRRAALGAALGLCALLCTSCAPKAAESNSISFSKVEFDERTQQLHIEGRVGSRLHVIYRTSTRLRGQDVLLDIEIALTRKSYRRQGMRGDFDLDIPLDPNIQRVLFGAEEKLIWQRSPS